MLWEFKQGGCYFVWIMYLIFNEIICEKDFIKGNQEINYSED